MKNSDYFSELEERLDNLKKIRKTATIIAKGFIGSTLYLEDLFFSSVLDRSLFLLDGFVDMIETRNLSCAGILLRALLDNCMRLFASYIAEDKSAFIDGFFNGRRISDFKTNTGKKMTDYTLRKSLEVHDSRISAVYERTSGYVHLSGVAFYSNAEVHDKNYVGFSIGQPLRESANKHLLEASDAFIHYMLLLYQLFQPVIASKQKVESNSG